MKFKAEEPSHGTFFTFRKTFESLMNENAQIPAYTQQSGMHANDADTCTYQDLLNENGQL